MFRSSVWNHYWLDHIQESAIRLIRDDNVQSFQNILEITNDKTIHKNLKCFVKEIYKLLHALSPTVVNNNLQKEKNSITLVTSRL